MIFATSNNDKVKELKKILNRNITSLKDLDIHLDIEEKGKTFTENAFIKAEYIAKKTNVITVADDSGLEIYSLDNQPGIHSSRFMKDYSYSEKNKYLLNLLQSVPDELRGARFVCAMSCYFPDGRNFTVEGVMEGKISYEIKGEDGFGYDPIFIPSGYDKTCAELHSDEKNQISHRYKAIKQLMEKI